MMMTDYIRSDGRRTDTPTMTSLTWKCVAAVFNPLRGSQMAFAWSRKNEGDDTLRRSCLGVQITPHQYFCAGDSEGVLG